jgi:NADH-quinone oxidoreductase subunit F
VNGEFLLAYRGIDVPGMHRIGVYEGEGGYQALRKVLTTMDPEGVVDLIKRSRLHGRGGAAFPTGLKWEFVSQDRKTPKYVVCNAEEGEPGTFKDRPILEKLPHRLVEAMAIAGYAVGARRGYVVFRGEFIAPARIVRGAIEEAREKGYLGENIMGSGFSFDLQVYRTAGAYICGEETALLEALEGKAGLARIRPPFPVNAGLWARPTALNNVETFANVPDIVLNGPEWYQARGTEKFPGTKIYCLSGHVRRPGAYELPAGVTLRELIYDYGGGILDNRDLKAVFPGGASSSCLVPESLDLVLDYASVAVAGSMLGSGAVIVVGEGTCMPAAALRLASFFRHESCGKCIPCREGTEHIVRTLEAVHAGHAGAADLAALEDLCVTIRQTAFCGLGQAAVNPVLSTLKHFRAEYEAHLDGRGCPNGAR